MATATMDPVAAVQAQLPRQKAAPQARPAASSLPAILSRTGLGTTVKDSDSELVSNKLENANDVAAKLDTSFRYQIHKGSKAILVKVVDNTTGKVVREIPSAKFLDMMQELQKLTGFIINEKA